MRKLSLFETNKSTNLLTERMMSDVERLINNISPLITDFETFKLLSLITLFTGVGDTMPTIAKLRNRYLTVLRRRPLRVNKKMKLEVGTEYNTAVYKQVSLLIVTLALLKLSIRNVWGNLVTFIKEAECGTRLVPLRCRSFVSHHIRFNI